MSVSEQSSVHLPDQRQHAPTAAMREAALLIAIVRGDHFVADNSICWETLHNLAADNRVLLPVFHALQQAGAEIPGFFVQSACDCRASSMQLAADLRRLLAEFVQQKMDVLPLKGPALGLELYGDATLRQSDDLDLLVRIKDFPRAEALLIDQGFLPLGSCSEYDRKLLRNGLLVELHFELSGRLDLPLDVEGVWRRARLAEFHSAPACAMSREDLALYLCCHGLKHRFARLGWILDFAQSLHGWSEEEYKSLLQRARQQNLLLWLLTGCEVVRTMLPRRLPEALNTMTASSPLSRQARRTAGQIFSDRPQDAIYDFRALYLQNEPNPLKRLRYRLQYLAPTRRDHQWARLHHIHPGLMFALRPFRLLGKYGVRKTYRTLFPARN
jgi:hypothetical protein